MKVDSRAWFSLVVGLVVAMTLPACEDSPTSPNPFSPPTTDGSGDDPLNACFTAAPGTFIITAGQTVTFDASCTVGFSSDAVFRWDLGDGRTDSGPTVEAKYEKPGDFDVRLVVEEGRVSSATSRNLRVNPRPVACFSIEKLIGVERCAVRVDASCSTGSIEEYEWFFEGGPAPPLSLPDVTVTTESPVYQYSWAEDEFCFSFRPFERTIRLTVHDESGVTDSDEDVVVFTSPVLKR